MDDWFEWNGVKCTTYGMHVLSFPSIVRPLERTEPVTVPDRSGTLTVLNGVNIYDDIALSCSCIIDDTNDNRIANISGWLKGGGNVTFANRTDGFYTGRIVNQISFETAVRNNPHKIFSVQFRCNPFFYLFSGTTPSESSISPIALTNPGNFPSEPLIKVVGSGEGSIMCGSSSMIVNSLDGIDYLMLDCEAKLAYKGTRGSAIDPLILLGTRITGEWLTIPTGSSFLTFTGGITGITLTPRWMCI